MNNDAIVNAILQNQSAHQDNRADKMKRTVNVMVSNKQKQVDEAQLYIEQSTGDIQPEGNRGYGEGRKMGDWYGKFN